MSVDPSLTVLVVDDFATMRYLAVYILRHMGIQQIFEAEDGESALSLLHKQPVDLVISDYRMPNLNGVELMRAMRQDPVLSRIPVILASAEDDAGDLEKSVVPGITECMSKPYTLQEMREKILILLNSGNEG